MRPAPRRQREMPMWVNVLFALAIAALTIRYVYLNWPSSLIEVGLIVAVMAIVGALMTRYTSILS